MIARAVVEKAMAAWNNHDREGYIACCVEDWEYNAPRRPGKGRAAVAAFWDFNAPHLVSATSASTCSSSLARPS